MLSRPSQKSKRSNTSCTSAPHKTLPLITLLTHTHETCTRSSIARQACASFLSCARFLSVCQGCKVLWCVDYYKTTVLSQRWPRDASYMSASHVSSQSRAIVELNRIFFVRFLVSPKFLHVPLGVGWWPLGYEQGRCWANCPCNSFPRFPTYVITIHQRYRRTVRQTDGMRSQDHALHYSASRGKKSVEKTNVKEKPTKRNNFELHTSLFLQ